MPAGEFEGRIETQKVEVVGVLISATDRKDPGADHVGETVCEARRVAGVGNEARQSFGDAEATLRQRQQYDAAVPSEPTAIEGGCDFLARDGRKRKAWKGIVGRGGRGRADAAEKFGVDKQTLLPISLLRCARRPKAIPLRIGRVSKTDPDAKVAKIKNGSTHLAYQPEHAVDLDLDKRVIVTAQIHEADKGDTTTLEPTLEEAAKNLSAVDCRPTPEDPCEPQSVAVERREGSLA